MKKIFQLVIALVNLVTFAQDTQLFYQHEVPTYSYSTLYIGADNLLGYVKYRSVSSSPSESFSSSAGLVFNYENQSPLDIRELEVTTNHYYYKTQSEYKYEVSQFTLSSNVKNHKYFFKKSWFLATDARFYFQNINHTNIYSEGQDLTTGNLAFFLGGGFGRVINTRSLAKAHALINELAVTLTDEKIIKVAELIDRFENGFYSNTYKDDSSIKFFEDLHEVIGSSTFDQRIEQILNTSLYKYINRQVGFEIMAGMKANIYQSNLTTPSIFRNIPGQLNFESDFYFTSQYTLPITWNKQFSIEFGYTGTLQSRPFRANLLETDVSFSIEHKYNWASSFSVSLAQAYFKDVVEKPNFFATASTQMVVLNQLVLSASAQYNFRSFSDFSSKIMPTYIFPETDGESTSTRVSIKYYFF